MGAWWDSLRLSTDLTDWMDQGKKGPTTDSVDDADQELKTDESKNNGNDSRNRNSNGNGNELGLTRG